MPAATCKPDLIAVTKKEYAKLEALLDGIAPALADRAFEGGWSIRDVILHRGHWSGLFFQWLEEGDKAEMPDHGVKWNGLKAYNAELRDRYGDHDWAAARTGLRDAHARMIEFLDGADEATLYGGPMPGGTGWTTGRYAEAAGASHYRSAAKFVRACVRASG